MSQLSGASVIDGNGYPLPRETTELYQDNATTGALPALAITNATLTSNVATLTYTAAAWQPFIGQSVTIAGVNAIYNGTFTITGINYGSHTFTYAKAHADDSTGAVAGTATPQVTPSPVASGSSDEVTLVVPANATELRVYCAAIFTLRKVSGGATLGTYTLAATTEIGIACQPGDIIYIFRTNAGVLNFRFKALK